MSVGFATSTYRVAAGHVLLFNHSGDPLLGTQSKVATAWNDGFKVELHRLPRWLEEHGDVVAEARHPAGRHRFTLTVQRIEQNGDRVAVIFTQPLVAHDVDYRRARRVDLDVPLLWSRLDAAGRPGVEHDGALRNLSATGLRFVTRSDNIVTGETLMFSLGLDSGRINVPGQVVGVGKGLLGEIRIDFGMVDVERRRQLAEVVAAHRSESPDEVISAVGLLSERVTRARAAYGA